LTKETRSELLKIGGFVIERRGKIYIKVRSQDVALKSVTMSQLSVILPIYRCHISYRKFVTRAFSAVAELLINCVNDITTRTLPIYSDSFMMMMIAVTVFE